jgi:PII-like signaling protein
MKIAGPGMLLRIFIGESDRWHGRTLHEALLLKARESGLAGATVVRGVGGFGAHSRIHTAKVLRLSEDLPMIIEIVDREDRIRAFIPTCDEMIVEGLITLERVEILKYSAGAKPLDRA